MPKLLSFKDYLMLGLGLAGEFSEELRLFGKLIPNIYEIKYGQAPPNFKRKTYLSNISKLLKTGEITKDIDQKGNAVLSLSTSGFNSIKRKFPIFTKSKWDGRFMTVIFDIPEKYSKSRQGLRNKLKELGFGMIQESVWISPYHFEEDLKEYLDTKGYKEYVFVLVTQNLVGGGLKEIARKIWKLDQIHNQYVSILNETNFNVALRNYLNILAKDPILPMELLPDDWPRQRVIKYICSLASTKNARPVK